MKVTLLVALFFWGVVPLFVLWLMWRNDIERIWQAMVEAAPVTKGKKR